jgi:hypothetical protein
MKIKLTIDKIELSIEEERIEVGDEVLWLYTAPTGWNPSFWVGAKVIKITPKRVTIEAKLKNGDVLRRSVKPEKLKLREAVQS